MEKMIRFHVYLFSIIWLSLFWNAQALMAEDVPGCAGTDTSLDICSFCPELDHTIDFLASLSDNPQAGGNWIDLDNSGLNITDPAQVDVAGLKTGVYRFSYITPADLSCPIDTAVLTLNVTGANTLGCVDLINATLDANCTFELTVDNVLAGAAVCEDELMVLAFDFETGFNGNLLTQAQVGKYLDVVLFRDGCSVPVCNSAVYLRDLGIPSLDDIDWRGDDQILYCDDLSRIAYNQRSWADTTYDYYLGGPGINDCSGYVVAVTDNVLYAPCGSNLYATLQRTFIITDQSGNMASTTLEAEFVYPDPAQIIALPDLTINACDPNGIPVPDTWPFYLNSFGDTIYLAADGCNYALSFVDRDYMVCGGARKVERVLRYFDWCTERSVSLDTLVIKIGDFTGPVIQRPVDTAIIPTSPFGCGAAFPLQTSVIESLLGIDILDCNPEVKVSGIVESWAAEFNWVDSSFQKGIAVHHDTYIDQIPPGLHRFIMTLSDGCKSESVDTVYFRVADQVPPIISCEDHLLVSMSEGPYGKVDFTDINVGSTDNCALVELKLRRYVPPASYTYYDYNEDGIVLGDELMPNGYTRFNDHRTQGNFVEYHCNDLLQPTQLVELWGWDAAGNTSTCWTSISLEDKLPPVCLAPADTVVACYDYLPDDVAAFGQPEVADFNCGIVTIEELPTIEQLDQCGNGTIFRQFQAIKNPDADQPQVGPLCVQTITIERIQDYQICFPPDTSLDCGEALASMSPFTENNGCALFAQSHEDVRLVAENEACYQIMRTWSIINWCEYEVDDPFVVIGRDIDNDGLPGDEAICVVVTPAGLTYLDRNTNPFDASPNLTGYWINSNDDPGLTSTGFWKYTQYIDVFDTTPPDLSYPDSLVFDSRLSDDPSDCFGLATIPFSILETCDSFISLNVSVDLYAQGLEYLDIGPAYLFGSFPDFEVMTEFPLGNHQLRVEASDGCGNTRVVDIPFEVVDRQAPAPICADMLAVSLSLVEEGGALMARVTAPVSALLASPVYDCNGQGPDGLVLDYSINLIDSTVIREQRELTFDCADADRFIQVAVHAWDDVGNSDYCTTFIHVQDNNNVCAQLHDTGMIRGTVQTLDGDRIEEVLVELSGSMQATSATGNTGDFVFTSLPRGDTYQVRPYKDDDTRNGVSTLDLIKIQKHVLGETRITNPYRLIAADVNNSGSVTTLDLIQLRKVILQVDGHFRNNTSWRFIEANYEFPNQADPWQEAFPEAVQLDEVDGPIETHFVGVKIGDVNGSAVANHLADPVEGRNSGQAQLFVEEQSLLAGEVAAVTIRLNHPQEIGGIQGTLHFAADKLRFLTLNHGLFGAAELGHFGPENRLSFSWNRPMKAFYGQDEVLLTLYFQAQTNVYLSNAIQLNSSITEVEAYSVFEEPLALELVFEGPQQADRNWELFASQPNPFREMTTIPFFLDTDARISAAIFDQQGRRIWQRQALFSEGLQRWILPATVFPAKGLYHFQMEIDGVLQTQTIVYE